MKVGLFFGSFNPIHVGHMVLANYMLVYTDLDQVWFVVSPQNPLKTKSSLLNEQHRLQLVQLAIGDHAKLKACDIEFHLSQPSYTIHTLYVYPRYETASENYENNNLLKHSAVTQIAAPRVEISSTAIRQAILDKKDLRYFVPSRVWDYIKEMHFYERKK